MLFRPTLITAAIIISTKHAETPKSPASSIIEKRARDTPSSTPHTFFLLPLIPVNMFVDALSIATSFQAKASSCDYNLRGARGPPGASNA
jgi:hypothetical protein